jgi:S-methylmethionine-dependent homocysteine/selenocysteine methylase
MKNGHGSLDYLSEVLVLTDGGMETTLIFHKGFDLPYFAAFVLLADEKGRSELKSYYRSYIEIARTVDAPLILETATWRANPDWAEKIGYSPSQLDEVNRLAVQMIEELRREFEQGGNQLIVSGCIGPRGDGYVAADQMNIDEAKEYHRRQIGVFKDEGADVVTAITMTYENEAIGIANAAAEADIPCVISFTVETDGYLPNGSSLEAAIRKVDTETGVPPAYYMINCAHPSHFLAELEGAESWKDRMSHAELDEAEELDDGDPVELAEDHFALRRALPQLTVVGGCCGTDERHVGEIARALRAAGETN